MSYTEQQLQHLAIDYAKRRANVRPEAIEVRGADLQDHETVAGKVGTAAQERIVQPVAVQLHHDKLQLTEWSHAPERTWTVAVLLNPNTGEVLDYGRHETDAKAAKRSAVRSLAKTLQDNLLRELVTNAVAVGLEGDAQPMDVRELHPGDYITAWGHGRYRGAVVVQVTKQGTVHYAFTTPTNVRESHERGYDVTVTRGKGKAGDIFTY